jgi:hypothetical protein
MPKSDSSAAPDTVITAKKPELSESDSSKTSSVITTITKVPEKAEINTVQSHIPITPLPQPSTSKIATEKSKSQKRKSSSVTPSSSEKPKNPKTSAYVNRVSESSNSPSSSDSPKKAKLSSAVAQGGCVTQREVFWMVDAGEDTDSEVEGEPQDEADQEESDEGEAEAKSVDKTKSDRKSRVVRGLERSQQEKVKEMTRYIRKIKDIKQLIAEEISRGEDGNRVPTFLEMTRRAELLRVARENAIRNNEQVPRTWVELVEMQTTAIPLPVSTVHGAGGELREIRIDCQNPNWEAVTIQNVPKKPEPSVVKITELPGVPESPSESCSSEDAADADQNVMEKWEEYLNSPDKSKLPVPKLPDTAHLNKSRVRKVVVNPENPGQSTVTVQNTRSKRRKTIRERNEASTSKLPEESEDEATTLRVNIDLEPLLTIPTLIGATRVNAVIDTGSQISIINSGVVDLLGLKPKPLDSKLRLMMANGMSSLATSNVRLTIQVGSRDHDVDFVIVPNFPNSLLLGLDFILRNDVVIVPSEREIWINSEKFEIPEKRRVPRNAALVTTGFLKIPARTEVLECLELKENLGETVLCEGAEAATSLGLLVAGTVSKAQKHGVAVRIANPTFCDIQVPRGVPLAQAQRIEVVAVKSFGVVADRPDFRAETAEKVGKDTEAEIPENNDEEKVPKYRHFKSTELDIGSELTESQKDQITGLINSFPDIMSQHESDVGCTDLITHNIHTGDAAPINQRPYRLSFRERAEVAVLVDEYLEKGLIQESDSPWACPIVLVKKKDGTLRFCCDWRKLNAVTRKDAMPLPRIDDMIDRLAKAKYFSKLDFTSGYYQVRLAENAREKTAFVTPDGHYEWLVMGMGLTNAPATFQRLMYKVLGGLLWTNSMAYLDDIVIFSATWDDHLKDLGEVFQRIRKAKLKIKPPKCSFGKFGIQYLGFIISPKGVECDPQNTQKVAGFQIPRNKKDVQSFLGLAGYYRKFVHNFADVAKPLHELTKDNVEFEWSDKHQKAFETLRNALITPPILAFPNFDREFIIATDASKYGVGCILKQKDDQGRERVIAYASKLLKGPEQTYPVTERECLALRYATQVFRPYLYGKKFRVVTDHRSLQYMKNLKSPSHRLDRFSMDLDGFDFDIEYKQGKHNTDADTLSRYGFSGNTENSGNDKTGQSVQITQAPTVEDMETEENDQSTQNPEIPEIRISDYTGQPIPQPGDPGTWVDEVRDEFMPLLTGMQDPSATEKHKEGENRGIIGKRKRRNSMCGRKTGETEGEHDEISENIKKIRYSENPELHGKVSGTSSNPSNSAVKVNVNVNEQSAAPASTSAAKSSNRPESHDVVSGSSQQLGAHDDVPSISTTPRNPDQAGTHDDVSGAPVDTMKDTPVVSSSTIIASDQTGVSSTVGLRI